MKKMFKRLMKKIRYRILSRRLAKSYANIIIAQTLAAMKKEGGEADA